MISLLSRDVVPLTLGASLLAAGALVSTVETRVPATSAVVQIWGDLVRDVDTIGLQITRVSLAEEWRIGDEIARDIERRGLHRSPELYVYVSAVGSALITASGGQPYPYKFQVIESPEVNAFAIPGGHVYVTTGLLAELKSEAELAFVIGHEISHILLKHCIGQLQYEIALRRIAGDNIAAIVGAAHGLVKMNYGRSQETDADLNGILMAANAGYDPRAALNALTLLARIEAGERQPPKTIGGEVAGGIGGALEDLARTHPQAAQRIADAEAMVNRNASAWQGKRFYVGVRNHTAATSRSTDDYTDEWAVFDR